MNVNPIEGLLSITAFLGAVLVRVLEGIVITITLSFIAFVNEAWRPYRAGQVLIPGTRGYHDRNRRRFGATRMFRSEPNRTVEWWPHVHN